ncbi:MAG: holin [Lachnospiraceae bacterium]|nr:holin [Lachnospiraceae bacterium]
MKLNLKVRFKNPVFIIQVILAILAPVLAYAGLTMQDITSWKMLGGIIINAASNPYVSGLAVISLWNAVNDPTTAGISDSYNALSYTEPKK